jgi:hypothetical protein
MFFRKKKSVPDDSQIVTSLVAFIVKDEALGTPVYLPHIQSERDADNLGLAPLIYIWNEDRRAGSFTVSINGKAVAHLLEGAVPRSDPRFNRIRDQVLQILAKSAHETTVKICESLGAFPSEIFA